MVVKNIESHASQGFMVIFFNLGHVYLDGNFEARILTSCLLPIEYMTLPSYMLDSPYIDIEHYLGKKLEMTPEDGENVLCTSILLQTLEKAGKVSPRIFKKFWDKGNDVADTQEAKKLLIKLVDNSKFGLDFKSPMFSSLFSLAQNMLDHCVKFKDLYEVFG